MNKILLSSIFMLSCAHLIEPGWASSSVAVTNAKLFTVSESEVIENGTILIRDGVISKVGVDIAIPANTEVIDAMGMPVTPGIVAAATQIGLVEVLSATDTIDTSADSSAPIGAAFDVQYAINPNSVLIDVAISDGVTTAFAYPSAANGEILSGLSAKLSLHRDGRTKVEPEVAVFAELGRPLFWNSSPRSRGVDWILFRNLLDESLAKNALLSGNSADCDSAMDYRCLSVAALRKAQMGGLPIAISVNRESDIRQAIQISTDFDSEVVLIGAAEGWRVAGLLAQAEIAVVLDPYVNLPMTFDQVGARLDNAKILIDAGVQVAFYVSDVNMSHNVGYALRERAGSVLKTGVSEHDALAAITLNPARIWHSANEVGSLEVGKHANLIIWDGDPFEPLSGPDKVIIGGTLVPDRNRQTALRDRYHPHNQRGQ